MTEKEQLAGLNMLQEWYNETREYSDHRTAHNIVVTVPKGKKPEKYLHFDFICAMAMAAIYDLADVKITPMPEETVFRIYMTPKGAKVFGRL